MLAELYLGNSLRHCRKASQRVERARARAGRAADLIALLGADVTLVQDVRGVDDGLRQDGISVAVAHVGLLVVGDALDVGAHGDRKCGAVLEEQDLVDEGRAELVGRDLRVGVGAQAEDLELHALDGPPYRGLRALHREVGEAPCDVDQHRARDDRALSGRRLIPG